MDRVTVSSVVLHSSAEQPPLLSILLSHVVDVKGFKMQPKKAGPSCANLTPQNAILTGDRTIAKFLALNYSATLPGTNALEAAQVEEWLAFAEELSTGDASPKTVSSQLRTVAHAHLALRTFFVGYHLTIADLAVWLALKQCEQRNKGNVRVISQSRFVNRWYQFVSQQPGVAAFASEQFASEAEKKKKAEAAKASKGDESSREISVGHVAVFKELSNVDKVEQVMTRFPPEPSGFLHIGHAKAALLNATYAKKYNGKLRVRFDDTNPSKEKDEFRAAILSDLATLGIKPDLEITHTSDHFDLIENYAIQLIKQGDAYIDMTEHEEMKEMRNAGQASKYRDNSIEENLRLFDEMRKGSPEGQKCVMRAKINPKDFGEDVEPLNTKNKCLRDPGMYRVVVDIPHNRTGTKYKAYPLYDLACPIVDSHEGVTHALRSNEYHDRNPLYDWVIARLNLRKVYIEDFSRLNFTYTLLSKRKLQWFVDNGLVENWDSPAFPTIQGILRRGMTVKALLANVGAQGASKSEVLMDMDKVWAINRKVIDPVVPRHTAISKEGAVTLTLSNVPEPFHKTVPKHKKNADLGDKVTYYSNKILLEKTDADALKVGQKVTLMDWGNCVIDSIVKGEDGQLAVTGTMTMDDTNYSGTVKLTWLALSDDVVPVKLVEFANLITKPKLEAGDNFADFVSSPLRTESLAFADANVRLLSKGQSIQFERKGYFICDQIAHRDGDLVEFVMIPMGSNKALGAK